ncbi:MAG: phosphoserine phosphatase SerB [Hyphomicrobium sp.]
MRVSRALVLTAAPGSAAVTDSAVCSALSRLEAGAVFDEGWLAPGEAWQALFSANETDDIVALGETIERALAGLAIDVNVLPDDLDYRLKRVLVADMESTIIEQELIDEVAGLVGRRPEVEAITAATMRGEMAFEASLKARVALFAGLEVKRLSEIHDRVSLMAGAETLIASMKAHRAHTALVTGGFSIFAERVAQRLGFDEVHANNLEVAGGRLTGGVVEPILGRAAKRERLESICLRLGVDALHSIAVGDGANDLDMLAAAGLGVAFRAKPKVLEAARAAVTGAVITHGDLSALLALQGVRPQT